MMKKHLRQTYYSRQFSETYNFNQNYPLIGVFHYSSWESQQNLLDLMSFFLLFLLLFEMSQIKSRNWTKKEDQDLLTVLEELKSRDDEATWNRIAHMIKQRNPESRKTGKQCRQRWANQLNPTIKRTENWTDEENQILFRLHFDIGNKWSQICNNIPGRTDNCVKNHFYSTMRRGMRKINSYIQNVKRKNGLAKMFKNQILNKILAISEGKNDNKYQFTQQAKELALLIKQGLIKLALRFSQADEQNLDFKEKIYQQISEFSRNCRKKKTKKLNQLSEQEVLLESFLMDAQNQKEEGKTRKDSRQEKEKKGLGQSKKKSQICEETKKNKKGLVKSKMTGGQFPIQQPQNQTVKVQKNIVLQQHVRMERSLQINTFPWVLSSLPSFESFYNLPKNKEEANQEFYKKTQRGEINFLDSIPEIKKNDQQKHKMTENINLNDAIKTQTDLSKDSQYYSDKVSTTYPQMMKSSELQLGYSINFSSHGRQSQYGPTFNVEPSYGISFSPGISPFTFCTMQQGFNYFSNWPVQEEKYKSSIIEQSSITDRLQNEKDPTLEIKSSFKAIKREKQADNILRNITEM